MFLKRIELSGFKSFADKTVIQFDAPLTGVVGPNGCGKSNITDAIRWVLGEQSAKSLRSGSSVSDMIFAGSQSRKAVNTAKATLVFDNSSKIFDSSFDEIEITRQISRNSPEIVNYINKTQCRLKDIQDLVMDTGLGRDSLSIITQGNISSFADARPEDRRLLFEEAAGVAKYKKRKKISLAKLETVKDNLDRVQDLADSYQEQIETLEEQAEKARTYIECRDRLAEIEISVLAMRIEEQKQQEQQTSQSLLEMKAQSASKSRELEEAEERNDAVSKERIETDGKISVCQNEISSVLSRSMSLQKQKAVLDERRKIALSSQDQQERKQSLLELFSEARFEYEDRRKRLSALGIELSDLQKKDGRLQNELARLALKKGRLLDEQHKLSNSLAGIETRLAHPPNQPWGVQAVMKNRNRLPGIHGLVRDLLSCEDAFLLAVQTALASAADQIVVSDEACARKAIAWLKQSRTGRATFLPLTVCKTRSLQLWQQQKLEHEPGILGPASEFVSCDERYSALKGRLLGTILIAKDLESANHAARKLNQTVKIVTLEGDVVHAGGAMSGGFNRSASAQTASLIASRDQLRDQIAQIKEELNGVEADFAKCQEACQHSSAELMQKQLDREKLSSILQVKQEKYESLQVQIAQLDLDTEEQAHSDLVAKLSSLHARQDELNSQLKVLQESRGRLIEKGDELTARIRLLRRELNALTSAVQDKELLKARLETRLEQDLSRLGADYSLTFEAARAQMKPVDLKEAAVQVKTLRKKLTSLGDVNLQAPAQLEEISQKYEFLSSQMKELEEASRQILEAVDDMDRTMVEKFSSMFEKINQSLDEVFKAMFGGGKARLVLCDPDDLLNTGIDVDVQPPGKAVKNLQTFSGGEKALIAISVLFAILKARTVPLCIFDEVEAALDQANVERFARYLSNFKDQSQFIAVTHRPGTMEQCDTLYGITMQQDGVSQVLRVLLKDAREMSRQV